MNAAPWSWRDWSALAALLLVLIVCLPIFVCMPPWVDAKLCDICDRVILRGGVLYRDTFDTNLAGMAWLHLAIRIMFGWNFEAIRAADLFVVAGIVFLLVHWVALERVAAFLRKQDLREDEPICPHESTMPLYVELNKSPTFRLLFYGQAGRLSPPSPTDTSGIVRQPGAIRGQRFEDGWHHAARFPR